MVTVGLRLVVYRLIIATAYFHGAFSVQCYCTEEGQCGTGYCDSQWCLIGVKQSGNVVRMCAFDDSLKNVLLNACQSEVDGWSEVCGCDKTHCNTFAYLRLKLSQAKSSAALIMSAERRHDIDNNRQSAELVKSANGDPASASHYSNNEYYQQQNENFDDKSEQHGNGPPNVVITRPDLQKTKADGTLKFGEKIHPKESHLMIVLIVVPLSVGATAVCVILLNYYCKLC